MTVMVALLRGVNVGGKTTLPMADLRQVAADLGYDDVATYIQSGNLLFRAAEPPATVARDLAAAIASLGGVEPAVMVRTRTQLAALVEANPFIARDEDPARCHVLFAESAASRIAVEVHPPEEAIAIGTELHLFLPNGVGRSPLAIALTKAKAGTVRSWKTVTKLLELASAE